jgi:hypothetical protein
MKSHVSIMGVTVVCLCAATLVGRAASPGSGEGSQGSQTGQAQPAGPPAGGPGPRGGGPMGGGPGGPGGPMGMGMPFGGGFGGPMGMPGAEVVAGAPYSAQAVTEITQTLPDGNRIVRKVTASVYRDSAGRVRRDQVLAAVGSWMPDAQPKTAIIDDPIAHFHYILNPDRQTAARFPAPEHHGFNGPRGNKGADAASASSAQAGSGAATPEAPGPDGPHHRGPGTVQKTSLGTQTIEGVQATGTQSVLTIEAGAIGNDQAIRMVWEEWYSADLKTVVLSKRTDPRFGETVYQLTQINRAEPDAALFQVPSTYTITDGARPGQRFGGGSPRQGRRPQQ